MNNDIVKVHTYSYWLALYFSEMSIGDFFTFLVVYMAMIICQSCHRLDGLTNRNLFSRSSIGWKFKIKVLAGLASRETSLSPHMAFVFPRCVHISTHTYKPIIKTPGTPGRTSCKLYLQMEFESQQMNLTDGQFNLLLNLVYALKNSQRRPPFFPSSVPRGL